MMISSIILAAGMSSRMGTPKQLIKIGTKSLLRITTENVLASNVDEVIVVTGYHAPEIGMEVKDLPVKVIYNSGYVRGQGTSLAAGVKALHPDASAFLVFNCDQPLIGADLINRLVKEFYKSGLPALRPVFRGYPGHPVIISSSLAYELKNLSGDEGARENLSRLGDKLLKLPVENEAVVFDVDTPEDLELLRTKLNFSSVMKKNRKQSLPDIIIMLTGGNAFKFPMS
jgi:molybdenum cofactor cytidylyltransferase